LRKNIKRSLKRKQRREQQALISQRDEGQQEQPELRQTSLESNFVTIQKSSVEVEEPKVVPESSNKAKGMTWEQSPPYETLESEEHSYVSINESYGETEKAEYFPQSPAENEESVKEESSAKFEQTAGKQVDLKCISEIRGVKLDDYYSAGNTPVIDAAIENDMDKFMELIPNSGLNIPNYRGFTVLHALVENGRADIIRTLGIRRLGPILNAQTHDTGSTPLILAVKSMRANVCHALADTLRADIFLPDNYGFSALAHALDIMSTTRNDVIVRILLETIDDVYCRYASALNALGFATAAGMVETTEFLIDTYGLDVNYPLVRFPHGDHLTPLILAAELNHANVVKLLTMKYNADPCPLNNCGDTALIRATMARSTEVVRYLCGLKNMRYVDLIMKNFWNQTAHSLAVQMHHVEIVEILNNAMGEKHKQYCKARKKAQKRRAYQMRKQAKEEKIVADSIKAYHP